MDFVDGGGNRVVLQFSHLRAKVTPVDGIVDLADKHIVGASGLHHFDFRFIAAGFLEQMLDVIDGVHFDSWYSFVHDTNSFKCFGCEKSGPLRIEKSAL